MIAWIGRNKRPSEAEGSPEGQQRMLSKYEDACVKIEEYHDNIIGLEQLGRLLVDEIERPGAVSETLHKSVLLALNHYLLFQIPNSFENQIAALHAQEVQWENWQVIDIGSAHRHPTQDEIQSAQPTPQGTPDPESDITKAYRHAVRVLEMTLEQSELFARTYVLAKTELGITQQKDAELFAESYCLGRILGLNDDTCLQFARAVSSSFLVQATILVQVCLLYTSDAADE